MLTLMLPELLINERKAEIFVDYWFFISSIIVNFCGINYYKRSQDDRPPTQLNSAQLYGDILAAERAKSLITPNSMTRSAINQRQNTMKNTKYKTHIMRYKQGFTEQLTTSNREHGREGRKSLSRNVKHSSQ